MSLFSLVRLGPVIGEEKENTDKSELGKINRVQILQGRESPVKGLDFW